ncbi:hypothetical protein QFZ97_007711 [Paraburkholderia youngii]
MIGVCWRGQKWQEGSATSPPVVTPLPLAQVFLCIPTYLQTEWIRALTHIQLSGHKRDTFIRSNTPDASRTPGREPHV